MSTVLFTWELGSGLGHLTRIRPLAQRFADKGHQVFLAGNEHYLAMCQDQMQGVPVTVVPAPVQPVSESPVTPISFAHVLLNCGFASADQLKKRIVRWHKLFDDISPDKVVADHSPTAILAAASRQLQKLAIGTGFECPPICSPLPSLRADMDVSKSDLQRIEAPMLETINSVGKSVGFEPLMSVAGIYDLPTETCLLTYPELDPYEDRPHSEYYGAYLESSGTQPSWPDSNGPRILVYLRVTQVLQLALESLADLDCSIIVAGHGVDPRVVTKHARENICFALEQVDLLALAKAADLVIHNGGHATTAQSLVSGTPLLMLPMSLEQSLTAAAVERMGAGVATSEFNVAHIKQQLGTVFDSQSYQDAADGFAEKYLYKTTEQWTEKVLNRIKEIG